MIKRATDLPESTGAEVEAKMQEIQLRISGTVDNQRALEKYEEVKDSTERLEKEVAAGEVQLQQEEELVQQRAEVRVLVSCMYVCMYVCMKSDFNRNRTFFRNGSWISTPSPPSWTSSSLFT